MTTSIRYNESFTGVGIFIEPDREDKQAPPNSQSCKMITASSIGMPISDLVAVDLPISLVIGFPLKICQVYGFHSHLDIPNMWAQMLGFDPNPNSTTFGTSKWVQYPRGPTFIMRADGEPLHINHLNAVVQFTSRLYQLFAFFRKNETECEEMDKEVLAKVYCPLEAFKKFYDDMKRIESKVDAKSWEGVEFPGDSA